MAKNFISAFRASFCVEIVKSTFENSGIMQANFFQLPKREIFGCKAIIL